MQSSIPNERQMSAYGETEKANEPRLEASEPLGVTACSALSSIYCSGKPTLASIPPGWVEVQCAYSPPRFIRGRDIRKFKFTDNMKLLEVYYLGGPVPFVIDFLDSPSCRQSFWRILDEYGIALRETKRRGPLRAWFVNLLRVFGPLRRLLSRKCKQETLPPTSGGLPESLPYPLLRHVGSSI